MMNEIIDVDYKEVIELSDKTTEELKTEANMLFSKMSVVANMGLMLMVETGQRLIILKERLGHGNWEPWAKENLNFSLRKANRMMRFAEKFEDENSVFFKSDNLTDIGISKVWALLTAPEEVAEEVDRLQRLLENNSQPEIAEFKVHSDQLQRSFISCRDCIDKITDTEKSDKMRMALKTIIQQLIDSLEV